jgi:hypothetical protein
MFSIHHTLKKTSLLLLLTILLLAHLPQAAQAQAEPSPGVAVTTTPNGVSLTWSAPVASAAVSVAALSSLLPLARIDGYDLPVHTVTLAIPAGSTPSIVIEALQATVFTGELTPAAPELPPVLDWTPMPNVGPDETAQLPTAPAFILRTGVNQGQQFVVVAISPIYTEAGVVKVASDLRAVVANAAPLAAAATTPVTPAQVAAEAVVVPTNQAALQNGYRITVSQPGIQEVPFSAFGGDFDSMDLHLTHRGATVAVEVLADRFRFYAPTVGDRWNATSVYWLTFDGGGARMNAATTSTLAAVAGQAFERGVWRSNKQYVSEYPGFDADHWYNTALTVLGTATEGLPSASLPVTRVLPDAAGDATYTTNLTTIGVIPLSACQADVKGYKVRAELLDSTNHVLTSAVHEWNPAPYSNGRCRNQDDWALTWTTDAQPVVLKLTLLASGVAGYNTSILIDAMEWQRPVTLNFGGQGAEFWTAAGAADFTLSNLPAARTLYDVTNPLSPVITPLSGGGATASFTQADSAAPRRYALANLATPTLPTVAAHSATNFGNVLAADALYIGPASFKEELQPLLDLRTRQGYTPLFVDVQAIFDVYGDGYSAAPAIRNFLRARSDWQNPNRTISVVLVGDGTYDPFNYKNTGFGSGVSHPIPPYMADVDIYINEAPCETCFAQLHGDDPITGDEPDAPNPKNNVFVPDVWLGRFPARNEAELTTMVAKIVGYETATTPAGWRSSQLLLADNFITSINAQNQVTIDPAGDFAADSDEVVQLFGYGAGAQRVYYDHSPSRVFTPTMTAGLFNTVERIVPEPWRIDTPATANQAAINAINAGVGLMLYNGHSNHWNYAKLEDRSGAAVAPLMSIVDAPSLANGDKLFVGLSMTCLTSQFAMPAVTGTLDELFVRSATGGAVATWGPSGQSVAHGHSYLQKGFVSELRNSPPNSQRMGALVKAGYDALLFSPTSSLDALKTFVLLGDPLTTMRANVGFDNGTFLPAVRR